MVELGMAQKDDFNKLLRDAGVVQVGDPIVRLAQDKLSMGITPSNKELARLSESKFYEQQRMDEAMKRGKTDFGLGFQTPQAQLYAQSINAPRRVRFTAEELLAAEQRPKTPAEPKAPLMPPAGGMIEYDGKKYYGKGYDPSLDAPEGKYRVGDEIRDLPSKDPRNQFIDIAGVKFPATEQQREIMGLKLGERIPAPAKVPSLISTTPRTENVGPMSQVPIGDYGNQFSPTVTTRRGGGVKLDSFLGGGMAQAPVQERTLEEIMSPFSPVPNERNFSDILKGGGTPNPFTPVPLPRDGGMRSQPTPIPLPNPFSPAPVSNEERLAQARRYIAESEAMARQNEPKLQPVATPAAIEPQQTSDIRINVPKIPENLLGFNVEAQQPEEQPVQTIPSIGQIPEFSGQRPVAAPSQFPTYKTEQFAAQSFDPYQLMTQPSVSESIGMRTALAAYKAQNKAMLEAYKARQSERKESYQAQVDKYKADRDSIRDDLERQVKGVQIKKDIAETIATQIANAWATGGPQYGVINVGGQEKGIVRTGPKSLHVIDLKPQATMLERNTEFRTAVVSKVADFLKKGDEESALRTWVSVDWKPEDFATFKAGIESVTGGEKGKASIQQEKQLSQDQAKAILREAGGNRDEARRIARERGFKF